MRGYRSGQAGPSDLKRFISRPVLREQGAADKEFVSFMLRKLLAKRAHNHLVTVFFSRPTFEVPLPVPVIDVPEEQRRALRLLTQGRDLGKMFDCKGNAIDLVAFT